MHLTLLIQLIDKLLCVTFSDFVHPIAQILINTYQHPVCLIIPGSGGLVSTEGTTQGDPLAMAMHALAVTPLIHHLHSSDPAVSQVWYADDATGVGKCTALRKWWDTLSHLVWLCMFQMLLKLIL